MNRFKLSAVLAAGATLFPSSLQKATVPPIAAIEQTQARRVILPRQGASNEVAAGALLMMMLSPNAARQNVWGPLLSNSPQREPAPGRRQNTEQKIPSP